MAQYRQKVTEGFTAFFIPGPVLNPVTNAVSNDGVYMFADLNVTVQPGEAVKMTSLEKNEFEAKFEEVKVKKPRAPRDPNAPKRGRKSKADKEAEAAAAAASATSGSETATAPVAEGASATAQGETKKGSGKKGA